MASNDDDRQQDQQQLAQALAAQAIAFEQQSNAATAILGQNSIIAEFWANQIQQIEEGNYDFKSHQLPLARIKKVMKTDEEVRTKMVLSC